MHGLRFTTVVTTFISARRTLCMQVTMRSATTSLPAVACGTTGSSAGPIPPDDPCKRNISQIISCSTRRRSSVAGVIVKLRSDALRRYARSGSSRFVAPNQVPGENRITRLLVDSSSSCRLRRRRCMPPGGASFVLFTQKAVSCGHYLSEETQPHSQHLTQSHRLQ